MKSWSFTPTAGAVLLAVVFLAGCSKLREEIGQHPSDIGKYCRIVSFADSINRGDVSHFNVNYDQAGRPLEFVQTDNLLLGLYGPDLHFRYDKKGRLSDVLDTDPGQTFVYIWSRYNYPSSRVIVDSVFEYQGNVNDPNPPYLADKNENISVIKLDGDGRPVSISTYSTALNLPPSTIELSYDRNGDLISPGVFYDDKVSIYQTSPTWQLYYGQFSRNNLTAPPPGVEGLPQTPAAYNAYGPPTTFLGPFENIFGLPPYNELDVTYSCDVSHQGVAD